MYKMKYNLLVVTIMLIFASELTISVNIPSSNLIQIPEDYEEEALIEESFPEKRAPEWQLRAGKRIPDWKLRGGKRSPDWKLRGGKRIPDWKLRGGKRIPEWKLRGGKRAPDWKLRAGKRNYKIGQEDLQSAFGMSLEDWKLRTGKRSMDEYSTEEKRAQKSWLLRGGKRAPSNWLLRGGKRSANWKLRGGKRADSDIHHEEDFKYEDSPVPLFTGF